MERTWCLCEDNHYFLSFLLHVSNLSRKGQSIVLGRELLVLLFWYMPVTQGMLSALDEGVGNITKALMAKGLWDDVLLVFSTVSTGAWMFFFVCMFFFHWEHCLKQQNIQE